jgi:hypothetical protein
VVRNPGEESHIVDVRSDVKLTGIFSELIPCRTKSGLAHLSSHLFFCETPEQCRGNCLVRAVLAPSSAGRERNPLSLTDMSRRRGISPRWVSILMKSPFRRAK